MKSHYKFLLVFTLISFLFSLALLSLPVRFCGDAAAFAEETCASDVDLCIACQLETDIHEAYFPAIPDSNFVLYISNQLLSSPVQRAFLFLRPPIA